MRAGRPPVVLSSHWAFLCDPSLSRTASASFGTCPTRFTGRSRKQSATRRRLPASPTVPGHTLPAASGPRKAKVRLASCSPARSCRTGRGRCLWLCVWNACLLGSAGVCPVRDVPCAVGFTLVLVVVVESGSVVGQ